MRWFLIPLLLWLSLPLSAMSSASEKCEDCSFCSAAMPACLEQCSECKDQEVSAPDAQDDQKEPSYTPAPGFATPPPPVFEAVSLRVNDLDAEDSFPGDPISLDDEEKDLDGRMLSCPIAVDLTGAQAESSGE
jgi:hypothetical protein